ncbi:MAG: VOC family protein [Bacteroidota bacterium]
MSNRPFHFEIPAENPQEVMKFYESVFGWQFSQMGNEEYWFAKTGSEKEPGINGAVMKAVEPGQPAINTIHVDNLDVTLKAVTASGGKIWKPKFAVPTVGWLAFFSDPDGNMHGAMQMDAEAK